MEPNCVSINLGSLNGGKLKCELNNATDENQFASLLQNKPAFTYLAIEVMSYMIRILRFQNVQNVQNENFTDENPDTSNGTSKLPVLNVCSYCVCFSINRIPVVAAHV